MVFLTLLCVAASLLFFILWRRDAARHAVRERWWRKAVRDLASRDFEGVETLCATLEKERAASTRARRKRAPVSQNAANERADATFRARDESVSTKESAAERANAAPTLRNAAGENTVASTRARDEAASPQESATETANAAPSGEMAKNASASTRAASDAALRAENAATPPVENESPPKLIDVAETTAQWENLSASTREEIAAPDQSTRALREAMRAMQGRDEATEGARRDLEDVLASLQDAVLVVDGETRVRFLNAAALQFFGVRVEEVLGAALLEALPSFELDAAISEALQQRRSATRDIALYVAGGKRDVLLRVAPVRNSVGGVTGAVAILQDLTEMRRLEKVRREFVANASHELRTPVANIRAGAETILCDANDAQLVERFLPRIISEAERLSNLVTDLLDLARAEANAEDAASTRTLVDLHEVATRTMQSLSDKAARLGVKLYCDSTGTARVLGDAAALEQVAFNLLDNALMYTPTGGRVALRVWGRENDAMQRVKLEIADTGIGIPTNDLEHIFERFYRVDKARSRVQGGTGLGLAIVKHIVENHGGHVAAKSEAGQGSTFTVTLPAA